MPTFPYLNREVKCAFRWYRDDGLRNRNLRRCGAPEEGCPFAINSPTIAMPPFQFMAGSGATLGLSTPVSWKVYDLEGNEVLDLSADLDKLNVTEFSNPSMEYVVYSGDTLSSPLPAKALLESVIELESGEFFYSETIKTFCREESGEAWENTDFTDGGTNWEYAPWRGLIVDIENIAGDPSYGSPEVGDQVINIADNLLYTWNGSTWDSDTPSEGDYFILSPIGSVWHLFTGGEFVAAPSGPLTIYGDPNQLACWDGTGDVALTYTPTGVTPPAVVDIGLIFFYGGGITGEVEVYWNGELLTTIDDAQNGQQVDLQVVYSGIAPNEFTLVPSGGFQACLTMFTAVATTDAGCRYVLEYWNCGDLGTQYYSGGFRNRIYLDTDVILYQPTPQLQVEEDTISDGSRVDVFSRKEVDYKLLLKPVPWWFLDAITEIPLHDSVTITDVGTDTITNVTIEAPWGNDRCLTSSCVITFNVDDATVNDSCCTNFDPPCVAPCVEASGFIGDEEPILDEYYLDPDSNQYAQYLGFDNGPVDAQGYDVKQPCTGGIAAGVNGFEDHYWDVEEDEWVRLSELSFEYTDYGCSTIRVTGTAHPRYNVRIQWSVNEVVWSNFTPDYTFSPEEFEAGVTLSLASAGTHGLLFLRTSIFFGECSVGESNVCVVTCTNMVVPTLDDDSSGWVYASGGNWTNVATDADLASIPGPSPGDLALTTVSPVNEWFYYDGSTWQNVNPYAPDSPYPPVLHTIAPDRMCVLGNLVDAIQGTLSSTVTVGQPYFFQITITGDLDGVFHFPGTFVYCEFSGAGTYSATIEPTLATNQFYIDFNNLTSGSGCVTGISIRPLCDE